MEQLISVKIVTIQMAVEVANPAWEWRAVLSKDVTLLMVRSSL